MSPTRRPHTPSPETPLAPPGVAEGPAADIRTLGRLRGTGATRRSVKAEVRENLLRRLRAGQPVFPGIVGFDETVGPALTRALLAGHDVVLLGERGQGKTRLIRTLVELLDEWTPVVAGCEIHDHPFGPLCLRCAELATQVGDDLPVAWLHRTDRYAEKLATPDTSVGDLIGDIDPVKLAEGRPLGDPQTVHYGLVPRTNRGIFAINELPDLAERIQVALLNVLEERDVQIRGYALRLPLDLLLLASANPEDYTNRGRIITPLKDRFGAEIRTHYPPRLADEVRLIEQETRLAWPGADLGAPVLPDYLLEVIARFTRAIRSAPQVDARSGVSVRVGVAAAETAVASAVLRGAVTGEEPPTARVCDLAVVVPAVRGKIEFESLEEGREEEILGHLLRRATADTFRARLSGVDLAGLLARFDTGETVATGTGVAAGELLRRIGPVPGLATLLSRLGAAGTESPGVAAAALEFALEGLYLTRRLSKNEVAGSPVYGG